MKPASNDVYGGFYGDASVFKSVVDGTPIVIETV